MQKWAAPTISIGLFMAFHPASSFAQAAGAPERGLSASANLQAVYDDNVFRSPFSATAGRKKADYRLVPSVDARYDLPIAGQGFYVSGALGYSFYARNDQFNREWWRVGTGVNWSLGTRCTGLADARYSQQQSDFADLGIALDNVEKRQAYSFSASCAGPAGIGLTGGVNYSKTDNSYFARQSGELKSFGYNAGLLYRSILIGDVTLQYMHDHRKYPNRFIATPLGFERDGVKVERVALAVTRPIGARLTGSANLSYIWSKPDVSVYDDFKGIGWGAALDYIVGPKLNVGISASRDVTSSAAIDSSYQVARSYGAYATYKMGSRTTLTAGVNDTRRKFRGQYINPLLPFILPLRDLEKTRQYYAQASYTPTDRWGLSLRYLHDKRNSTGSIYDYSGNTVSLSATVRY